ncbi:class I SAM-dependent methyltransferase [Mesorhizobium sp. LHD-90]|uniref:class I SAM-dependent methyltransferase n=1 Tax=Mesorhizobium sp. LHD-90 TaxID=3071414 RepID=UPI0027DED0B9|nr:class I SAM-dependent methyltransferase [Mesorhizobium sp. LHD-90]MDQ6434758.1 class I SAM-dependent methyltransferase [Mesorhizobium sp. LHD-90]
MSDVSPNRDQMELWNKASGEAWVDMQVLLDRMLEPFGRLVVDAGYPGEGGQALDIGCGCGATTLAMARRVGAGGRCVGLDISRPLIAAARRRAVAEGIENASFVEGDAQTYALDQGRYDAVISRFGVMFFDDPVAAFANIRRGVRPGAKLTFAAWRSPAENEFMTTAVRAAAPLLPPMPTPNSDAPGQFAFADGSRVTSILEASGWSKVQLHQADVPCRMSEADLMTYATRLGPVGAALRELDRNTAEKVIEALHPAFAPFVEAGYAQFTAACWLAEAWA